LWLTLMQDIATKCSEQLSAYRLTQGGAGVRWTDRLQRLDLGAASGGNHVALLLSLRDG
jgi:hypothetical protein